MDMNFTGERFVPQLRGQIYYEHFHRYAVGLSMVRGKDVLDIACGEGYGAAFLAMAAKSVVGVDIDEGSVRHAAARYPAMNLSFRAGSATQIPLADASVDVITSFETIEHLGSHEQMLNEMVRILRPDGLLLISSPNRLVYSEARGYTNPFHVRELYFHQFRDLLLGFFPEIRMYGQRIFGACAIHPIGGAMMETRWLGPSLSTELGIPSLPDPEYFVAICGRVAGEEPPSLSTVYIDLRDDLLSDIRSGGLMASDTPAQMLVDNFAGSNEKLALASQMDARTQEEVALAEQVYELERLRAEQETIAQNLAAECTRLTNKSQELEILRSVEYDRADRAERELRVVRRREAELQLRYGNLDAELRELSTQLSTALSREVNFELLLSKLSGLQLALGDAQRRIDEMQGSRSWLVTAPLRKVVSRMRSRPNS